MRQLLVTLTLALTTALPAAAQPAARPFDAAAATALQRVADPVVSPDGRRVAYRLRTADVDKDSFKHDLWLADTQAATPPRRLTWTGDVASAPQWVGLEALAFLGARGGDDDKKKGPQLWRLPLGGGEAEKLTDIKGGVEGFAVSPDGRRAVLVVMDEAPDPEQTPGWKRKTALPLVIDGFKFKEDREGYLTGRRKHLQLLDLTTRALQPLTTGSASEASPAWSPDGRRLAFLSNRSAEGDRTEATGLFVMTPEPTAPPRALATVTAAPDAVPTWSPDGRWIALVSGDDVRWSAYQQWRVTIHDSEGGASRVLAAGLDRSWQSAPAWTPDSESLIGVIEDDRHRHLVRVRVADPQVLRLTGPGTVSLPSVSRDGGIAYLAGRADQPAELYWWPAGAAAPQALSRHHAAWREGLQLSRVRDFSARSRDGTEVHGLLAEPREGQAPWPLVLLIHGGPNAQDAHELGGAGPVLRERLVAAGYAVLQMNYRGSTGRGQAFQRAIFADWGRLEVQDLQAAVDAAVRQGVADPARLGVGGWSYGGILTNYLIASDTRFKAAVSGAGSANQISMFGTDQYAVQYEREMGAPWVQTERWLKVSYPFFKADRIKTPTLFMGGEKDFNVPIAGSEQMYLALKMLGVPTQLVIYPGQYHGLSLPSYQRDMEDRFIQWMDRYLKPASPAGK